MYRLKQAPPIQVYQWDGVPDGIVEGFSPSNWVSPTGECPHCNMEMRHHGILKPCERSYRQYVCIGDYILDEKEVVSEKFFKELYEECVDTSF